jgi:hypothetical protein
VVGLFRTGFSLNALWFELRIDHRTSFGLGRCCCRRPHLFRFASRTPRACLNRGPKSG